MNADMVDAIASVYQQSFGGEPWGEGYSCPLCEKIFSRSSTFRECPSCANQGKSILLIEYWPKSKIVSDFYAEMKKPDAVCVVATESNGEVVGFAWGYQVSPLPQLDHYLDAPNLHEKFADKVFYLDECALLPSCQGKGLGLKLVEGVFGEQNYKEVILRTKDNSRMCNIVLRMGGKIIQYLTEERVIIQLLLS